MSTTYVSKINNSLIPDPNENVMTELFSQYEKVLVDSIITSFGLDAILFGSVDRYGGDVDTILNVRKIGHDPQMVYKNSTNETAYQNRGEYEAKVYHSDPTYRNTIKNAKIEFNEQGKWIQDSYVAGNKVAPNKSLPLDKQAQLDHAVAGNVVHNDRGRVLSGISGVELANDPTNFKYTNAVLNNNMRDKTPEEYIRWCEENPDKVNWNGKRGEPLPEDVKKRLLDEYSNAKKIMDYKINLAYYTSPAFVKDASLAAGKVGIRMGARQVLGFIFTEIWFSVKNEFEKADIASEFELEKLFIAIGHGINTGISNAKRNYKEIIEKFGEGIIAGCLSSLSTTLCNIFFTTAKRTVRIIRQSWASIVEATKILLLNPDNLRFGERMRAASKVIATGASIITGVLISEAMQSTGIGAIPIVGDILTTFCGAFVTGIMSCSLLFFLDRSKIVNDIVLKLNEIPTIEGTISDLKSQVEYFEQYAASLMNIDIDRYKKEVSEYYNIENLLLKESSGDGLNAAIKDFYRILGFELPWEGEFDSFMRDPSSKLVFQ